MTPSTQQLADPLLGQIINNFRIVEVIGKGGFGVVYRGEHVTLETPCAIKFLNLDLHADHTALQRFQREAKAMARLRHDNVAQVFDFGQWDEAHHYLIMEYLDGETLLERMLSQASLLPIPALLAIVEQVCGALTYIHAQGIVHRDLKPGNIFLQAPIEHSRGEQVKIIDFGIAQLADDLSLTQSGVCMGSPKYMAPEQAEGELQAIGPASDLYALATLLFHLLTGHLPLDGSNFASMVYHKIHSPPKSLAQVAPQQAWAPALEAFFVKALDKDPHQRFPDALSFWQEAQRAFEHQPRRGVAPSPKPSTLSLAPASPNAAPASEPLPAPETPAAIEHPSALGGGGASALYGPSLAEHTTGIRGEKIEDPEPLEALASSSMLARYGLWAALALGTFALGVAVVLKLSRPAPSGSTSGQVALSHSAPREPLKRPVARRPLANGQAPPTSARRPSAPRPKGRARRLNRARRRRKSRRWRRRAKRRGYVQLRITSQPTGAQVWDGRRKRGTTPFLLVGLQGQRFTLRIEAPRHQSATLRIRMSPRLRAQHVKLKPRRDLFKVVPQFP